LARRPVTIGKGIPIGIHDSAEQYLSVLFAASRPTWFAGEVVAYPCLALFRTGLIPWVSKRSEPK
jgi:hypothetical protein